MNKKVVNQNETENCNNKIYLKQFVQIITQALNKAGIFE